MLVHGTWYLVRPMKYEMDFFFPGIPGTKLFSSGRGSFRALSAAEHGGGKGCTRPCCQVWITAGLHGACTGRAKERTYLANQPSDRFPPSQRLARQWKIHFSVFCLLHREPRQKSNRFKLSPFLQRRTLLCACGPLLCVCGHERHGG